MSARHSFNYRIDPTTLSATVGRRGRTIAGDEFERQLAEAFK